MSAAKENLLFEIRRSVRYHTARRRFFERMHHLTTASALIFGSVAAFTVLSEVGPYYTLAAAGVVTLLSAIDLVAGSPVKARQHHDLARRFIELERIITTADVPSSGKIDQWRAERLTIEAEEPPTKKVLDAIAHNELLRAMGYDESHQLNITWYQRLCAQLFDIRSHTLRPPRPAPSDTGD